MTEKKLDIILDNRLSNGGECEVIEGLTYKQKQVYFTYLVSRQV